MTTTAKPQIWLHVSPPHRWGSGKIHVAGGTYRDTLCAFHIHGTRRKGTIDQVTCGHCLNRLAPYRLSAK